MRAEGQQEQLLDLVTMAVLLRGVLRPEMSCVLHGRPPSDRIRMLRPSSSQRTSAPGTSRCLDQSWIVACRRSRSRQPHPGPSPSHKVALRCPQVLRAVRTVRDHSLDSAARAQRKGAGLAGLGVGVWGRTGITESVALLTVLKARMLWVGYPPSFPHSHQPPGQRSALISHGFASRCRSRRTTGPVAWKV